MIQDLYSVEACLVTMQSVGNKGTG